MKAYDFKGNLLRGSRASFVADYKALADLVGRPRLLPDVFTSSTQYDALNRRTCNDNSRRQRGPSDVQRGKLS